MAKYFERRLIAPQTWPLKGIALIIAATLAFASADVLTKQVTIHQPISVVVAVRYLVNLGLLSVFLYARVGPDLWRVNRRGLVFARALCMACASRTMGLALRLMSVGETVAIVYLSPFAVLLLSAPVSGERVRPLCCFRPPWWDQLSVPSRH